MKKSKVIVVLFFYHLIFIVLSYQYALSHPSDSGAYWAQKLDITKYSWLSFAHYGTDFIFFLNYPLLKLGFPFWLGFFLYGTIGFLGVLKWMQWAQIVLGDKLYVKRVNILYLLFFLPNLHFWTATLGKEPLVFWAIATIFYAITIQKYKSVAFIIASILLVIIRPHVAMMLLAAVTAVFLWQKNIPLKKRFLLVSCSFSLLFLLLYMVLKLSKINYLNWDRISYYNNYSILSFQHSGSYVPMLDYNYFYKIFSFNFRPFFFDTQSILGTVASLENALMLSITLLALYFSIKFYKTIHLIPAIQIALLFILVCSLLYIQRYANLGIFMRTKIMFQPFMLIALFCIIKQGLTAKNSKP